MFGEYLELAAVRRLMRLGRMGMRCQYGTGATDSWERLRTRLLGCGSKLMQLPADKDEKACPDEDRMEQMRRILEQTNGAWLARREKMRFVVEQMLCRGQ
jgi:hypothetical protein